MIKGGGQGKGGKQKKKGKRSISNEKWGKDIHDDYSIKRGSQQPSTSWQGLLKRDSENVRNCVILLKHVSKRDRTNNR